MGFNRPCLICGTLSKESRCPLHLSAYNKERQAAKENNPTYRAKKKELYNAAYRKQAKWIRQTATICHLCNRPFLPGERIEADHLIAGDPNSELRAAHRICNQKRGNKPLDPPTRLNGGV